MLRGAGAFLRRLPGALKGARGMAGHTIDLPDCAEFCSSCVIPTEVRPPPH